MNDRKRSYSYVGNTEDKQKQKQKVTESPVSAPYEQMIEHAH